MADMETKEYTPRAQRFEISTLLRYRPSGQDEWSEGTTVRHQPHGNPVSSG